MRAQLGSGGRGYSIKRDLVGTDGPGLQRWCHTEDQRSGSAQLCGDSQRQKMGAAVDLRRGARMGSGWRVQGDRVQQQITGGAKSDWQGREVMTSRLWWG